MKKDIENRTDIELLVNSFYKKVVADEQLGYIFQDIAKVNWSTHLPTMYNFWENIVFFTGTYEGDPINLHKRLHRITPLTEAHFDQWIQLFTCTVDELFEGEKANLAKHRAIGIAGIMKRKIFEPELRKL